MENNKPIFVTDEETGKKLAYLFVADTGNSGCTGCSFHNEQDGCINNPQAIQLHKIVVEQYGHGCSAGYRYEQVPVAEPKEEKFSKEVIDAVISAYHSKECENFYYFDNEEGTDEAVYNILNRLEDPRYQQYLELKKIFEPNS